MSMAAATLDAATPLDTHSNRVDVIETVGGRILCLADVRGSISSLNTLALEHNAIAIIHTGDFGYLEPSSLPGITDRTLRHLVQYTTLITPQFRSQLLAASPQLLRSLLDNPPRGSASDVNHTGSFFPLSEFPKLLTGELKLLVPVYAVWGACEDIAVLEKIRLAAPSLSTPKPTLNRTTGPPSYSIPNLTVLDEATTRVLVIGGVKLRLFGLGGAVVSHKLFDNGVGKATIAGGGGTMWTTVLQIGELVDTAQKVYDPTETRILISHASPGREGLISQLSLVLKADLTISAGLHFRYGASFNEFSVQQDADSFKRKLEASVKSFAEVWDSVKAQVETVIDENQRGLLTNALAVANRVPTAIGGTQTSEETSWKNTWNWNLPDASFGSLVLDIREGRIGTEMKSRGFNFAYRQTAPAVTSTPALSTAPAALPAASILAPTPIVPSAFPLSTTRELVKPTSTDRRSASYSQTQNQNQQGGERKGSYPHLPYHPETIRQAAAAARGISPASGTPISTPPTSSILPPPPTGPRADSTTGFAHTQGPLSVGSRYKGNASWGPSATAPMSGGAGGGGGGNYRKPIAKNDFDTSAPTYSALGEVSPSPAVPSPSSVSTATTTTAPVSTSTGGWGISDSNAAVASVTNAGAAAGGGGGGTKAPYARAPRQPRDRTDRSNSTSTTATATTPTDAATNGFSGLKAPESGGGEGGENGMGSNGEMSRGRGRGRGARSSRGRGVNGEGRGGRGGRGGGRGENGVGEGGEKSNGGGGGESAPPAPVVAAPASAVAAATTAAVSTI